jgi:SAM-dependent methyltransferase
MSSTYNARSATSYEHFMGRWSRQLSLRFVEFAGVSDAERILDVGCGTGSLTRVMLASANVKSIVGIDLADVYLESARQRSAIRGLISKPAMRPACHLRTTVLTGLLPCWFFISCRMQKRRWTKCDGSGGVVAATVWDGLGGMPALRLFWDAAATLGLADGKVLRDFYFVR